MCFCPPPSHCHPGGPSWIGLRTGINFQLIRSYFMTYGTRHWNNSSLSGILKCSLQNFLRKCGIRDTYDHQIQPYLPWDIGFCGFHRGPMSPPPPRFQVVPARGNISDFISLISSSRWQFDTESVTKQQEIKF